MAFVVMEPPTALEPRAISEEKNKVFRSMLADRTATTWCAASTPATARVTGWQGIPTPRRSSRSRSASTTGAGRACRSICAPASEMAEGMRIISIAFKEAPRTMFPAGSGVGSQGPDHLTFDLADNSKVSLSFYGKRPGPGMKLDKLSMQFSTQEIDTSRRRAGGLRAADPRRDARRPHAVHHRRGHRVPVGALGTTAGRPAAGQVVPAGHLGSQRRSIS